MKEYEFFGSPYEKNDNKLTGSTLHYIGDMTKDDNFINLSLVFEPVEKNGTSEKIKKNEFLNWIKEHSHNYNKFIGWEKNTIAILCSAMALQVAKNSRRGMGNKALVGKNINKKLQECPYKDQLDILIEESNQLCDNEIIIGYKGISSMWPENVDVGFLFKEHEDYLELFYHDTQLANVKNYFSYINFEGKEL